MGGKLDNLDSGKITRFDVGTGRERDLRQADRARVRVLGGAKQLEGRDHGVGHVHRSSVRSVGAEAQVDVEECRLMALEPAGLECDSAARSWPVRPVVRCVHSTTFDSRQVSIACLGL